MIVPTPFKYLYVAKFYMYMYVAKTNEWIDSVALGPYVLYMSARFYPKLTSFTSYKAAPAQTYML